MLIVNQEDIAQPLTEAELARKYAALQEVLGDMKCGAIKGLLGSVLAEVCMVAAGYDREGAVKGVLDLAEHVAHVIAFNEHPIAQSAIPEGVTIEPPLPLPDDETQAAETEVIRAPRPRIIIPA